MKEENRYTWQNDVKNQLVQPLRYYTPTCLNDIKEVIRLAEAENLTVRAVGSGHSFSDVVQTTGFLVNTDQLQKILPLNKNLLKTQTNSDMLIQVEGGIKLSNLNAYLDKNNMALPNMGGYDGQSIAGACSTSTHGSGIQFGPLTSFYRSITLVAAGGKVYQVEPTNGISDPAKHTIAHPEITLIQDDQWFNTVAVSMGCTGVIYSVIMEVVPKYWLEENRYLSNWEEVKAKLIAGNCLTENRHFEVLVNPYKVKGKHICLITERNMAPEIKTRTRKRGRHFLTRYLGFMPLILKFLDYFFNHYFQIIPRFIDFAMKGLVDKNYVDVSYNILNLGTPNYISAYSAEMAFPLQDHAYIQAVESMFDIAEKAKDLGRVYHTSPISLRFTKASEAYLSMMNGRDTCTVEIPVINYTYGGFELLHLYESNISKFNGRAHWGQVNTICTDPVKITKSFPDYHKWFDVYKQLNCKGTFNNEFTNRMGFSI
jgi:hypothetical protein